MDRPYFPIQTTTSKPQPHNNKQTTTKHHFFLASTQPNSNKYPYATLFQADTIEENPKFKNKEDSLKNVKIEEVLKNSKMQQQQPNSTQFNSI